LAVLLDFLGPGLLNRLHVLRRLANQSLVPLIQGSWMAPRGLDCSLSTLLVFPFAIFFTFLVFGSFLCRFVVVSSFGRRFATHSSVIFSVWDYINPDLLYERMVDITPWFTSYLWWPVSSRCLSRYPGWLRWTHLIVNGRYFNSGDKKSGQFHELVFGVHFSHLSSIMTFAFSLSGLYTFRV
jgi:hypothetical protein